MARHFVEARLRECTSPALVDDATLLTTELAANAVRHSRTDHIELSIDWDDDRVRVAVADGSPVPPTVLHPDPLAPGGRGLQLVDALATRWGFERRPEGKVVWFELSA
jgi:anti-sigma regulatory factor (Ser/Thr protein kinase)